MNAYLSKKFKILSAISILMVLYIHMYYTEGKSLPILQIIEGTMGQYSCSRSSLLPYFRIFIFSQNA